MKQFQIASHSNNIASHCQDAERPWGKHWGHTMKSYEEQKYLPRN